jgi:DNA-binding CsgD family transcriptional regulator
VEKPGELMPPAGLEATVLDIDGDELALLTYPLPAPYLPPELTPSERDVVLGVLRGDSMAALAQARGRSINTVKNQLRSAYTKLGVGSRVELVQRCRTPR